MPLLPREALEQLLIAVQAELRRLREENALLRECLEEQIEERLMQELVELLNSQPLSGVTVPSHLSVSRH